MLVNNVTFSEGYKGHQGGVVVDADLDASAILIDSDGNLVDGMPVYYKKYNAAGVSHSGDARDGKKVGDDETITLDLNLVDARVQKAVISVTSYSDTEAVMFGSTEHPVAKLYGADGSVLIEAKLDEEGAFGYHIDESISLYVILGMLSLGIVGSLVFPAKASK